MAIKATVIPAPTPDVGSVITPDTFARIGSPEVFVPTDGITIGEGETLTIDGTLLINGELSGTSLVDTISELKDVDAVNPTNLSTLQYNSTKSKWESVGVNEFVDAVIDGGFADSESDYVEAFDLDGGYA
jgi:hypothetical protein